MPIKPPNLDDLRYKKIFSDSLKLIPQYTKDWTNFNAADPGITLIQMFSWMTEMVLYRVNKVPDESYVHFLNFITCCIVLLHMLLRIPHTIIG